MAIEYAFDEFGYLRDLAAGIGQGTPPDLTNYDTPGERARAQAALEFYEANSTSPWDEIVIDGAKIPKDASYYFQQGLGWAKYVSLPYAAQREAQRVYSWATGGRDITSDLYNNVANTASNLVQPAIDALRAAMEKAAAGAKTTLYVVGGIALLAAVVLTRGK